jgi:hypothetical protein
MDRDSYKAGRWRPLENRRAGGFATALEEEANSSPIILLKETPGTSDYDNRSRTYMFPVK